MDNFIVKGRVCLLTELNVKLQNAYDVVKRKDHNLQVTSPSLDGEKSWNKHSRMEKGIRS
jgi:hypothetical protein